MNRIVFILLFATGTLMSGKAQVEKGTLLLGGHVNLNFSTANNSYINLNPNTGIFLSNHFCIGLSMPIHYEDDRLYYGISPFIRYYLKSKEHNSLFFSASHDISSLFPEGYDYYTGILPLAVGVGHVWLINQSVGFETELVNSTNFDDYNLTVLVGFQIYFNKANK